jgi:hypothetical protein
MRPVSSHRYLVHCLVPRLVHNSLPGKWLSLSSALQTSYPCTLSRDTTILRRHNGWQGECGEYEIGIETCIWAKGEAQI